MRNSLKFITIILAIASIALSCEKTSETKGGALEGNGLLILNNGNWGSNDACISFYDSKSKEVSPSVFSSANGYDLGDLAQDILRDGDRYYIAVSGSRTIFITDNQLNVIEALNLDYNPRSLACYGDYIYVTLYEGYLGRIDKVSTQNKREAGSSSVRQRLEVTKVGPNPEGLAIADGKAWVANSGGYVTDENNVTIYNNTISEVDLATFSETSTITVNTNPKDVRYFDGAVYVSSLGNYTDIPAKLQRIEPATRKVSDIALDVPYAIACDESCLHVLCCGYDSNWNLIDGRVYEIASDGTTPVRVADGIKNSYSISPACDGGFAVGCSDYATEGKVLLYNRKADEVEIIASKGLNPIKVLDLR